MAQSILLDTCTFLWVIRDSPELSPNARSIFIDPENTIFLSAVSAWEISVKHGLGKLPLTVSPHIYVPAERLRHNISSLPLEEGAASAVSRLPPLHNDPFDRMLICQAVTHGLTLLTPDSLIHQYHVNVTW
ncbi:MAG: type II toxin-antitoxin system VapC family toxin [Gallionella sp.]|nr:type II toxin-antitoxin system VapC family toxin [Gallionella sp.]